jgi:hypothetical protein
MNEQQADKIIELLEQLVSNSNLMVDKIERIDDNLYNIKNDTSDLGQLAELSSMKSTLYEIEETMKKIDERGFFKRIFNMPHSMSHCFYLL